VHANDREGLERLGRYGARGPLAEERLVRLEDGRIDWATLHARTSGVDVLRCRCGGRLAVHSVVSTPGTAEEVLQRLGLWQPRVLLPPPRGPPQLQLLH
jgi:hypothetical protein